MKITNNVYLVGSGQLGLSHPFDCHIYLIDGGNELALIDTGAGEDVDIVLSNVENEGFSEKIGKIILTHHHADHAGGCKKIKEKTSCKVYIQKEGARYVEEGDEHKMGLVAAKRSGLYSPQYKFNPFKVDRQVQEGEEIPVGKMKLEVHHTPGHSKDSVCLYMEEGTSKMLFSGDVVFFEGKVGLLNFPGSSLADYRESFSRITSLSCDALLPGHGIFVLGGGNEHIKKADLALQKVSPPSNFL